MPPQSPGLMARSEDIQLLSWAQPVISCMEEHQPCHLHSQLRKHFSCQTGSPYRQEDWVVGQLSHSAYPCLTASSEDPLQAACDQELWGSISKRRRQDKGWQLVESRPALGPPDQGCMNGASVCRQILKLLSMDIFPRCHPKTLGRNPTHLCVDLVSPVPSLPRLKCDHCQGAEEAKAS